MTIIPTSPANSRQPCSGFGPLRTYPPLNPFPCRAGRLQRLLVHPIAVVHGRAGQLGDRQHSLIVLENPAELAVGRAIFVDRIAAGELDHHESELTRQPAVMELAG